MGPKRVSICTIAGPSEAPEPWSILVSHPEADINKSDTASIKELAKKVGVKKRIWSFFIIFGILRQS